MAFDRKEATTAGGTVTSETLSHKTSINAQNSLYGLIPGLYTLQNANTAWGDGATMYIRGLGTTNSRSPLIIIDGFERNIDDITVQEIEAVTVLKDAAALALYGVRGGNGVIYIKTKRGVVGKPLINFNYEFNMGTPNRLPELVDGYTYAKALNEGLSNDGLSPRYDQRELDAFRDQTYPDFYPNVDWWDKTLRDHSYGNNVNFNIQGGSEKVRYFAQLNWLDDRGILQPVSDNEGYSTQLKFSKVNIRTNLDIQATKTTQVQIGMLGNFAEHNRPGATAGNLFGALYQVPSGAFPVKTANGLWGGSNLYSNNPVAYVSGMGYARSQSRALYADMNIIQDLNAITPGLTASVQIGFDSNGSYWDNNTRTFAYGSSLKGWDGEEDQFEKLREETALSFSSSVGSIVRRFTLGAQANYDRVWNDHKLNATLFYSMDKRSSQGQNMSRAYIDVAAQAHYTYKNRYLLDLTMTGSAASVLNPDDRWGLFPSVGAGWILSEEEWLKNSNLDLLKLRASYGIAGRADFGMGLWKLYFGGGNSYYFGQTPTSTGGYAENQIAVEGLTYEKSHKLNVGIDLLAWKNLSVTVDGYYDHRTDILVSGSTAISSIFGMSVPQRNDGIVNSYGVEVAAAWSDRIGDFSYQIGGQLSFNRNEIIKMNEEYQPYDYQKRTGQSLNQIFGYEVEGIYQSQEEIDQREVKQYLGEVRPGDLKFKDQNGDKKIDKYDQVAMGYNETCPELYFGFNLGAEYKGLGFVAQFQGVSNYSKYLDTQSVYRPLTNNNTISQYYWDNRWSKDTPNGTLPRLSSQGSDNNYNVNSLWVTDASFLKLRTLELYYQLPQKWMKKTGFVKNVKLYARGHDLFSLDGIDIADPEALGEVHPTMKQYTFGFNLQF